MRYQLVAAALVLGLASPAFAQSRTLPAGSEQAAQPPIDWSTETARTLGSTRVYEGRSVVVGPFAVSPLADRTGDLD